MSIIYPLVKAVAVMSMRSPVVTVVFGMLIPTPVVTEESKTTDPWLYVLSVKSWEAKDSPACIYSGARDLMYEAVGLVKLMSYAIPTSPDEVNSAGREVLKDVFETEKISEPLLISRNFPEVIEVEVEAM